MREVFCRLGVLRVAGSASFLLACAHGAGQDSQMTRLQDNLAQVQAESDRLNARLGQLESRAADEHREATRTAKLAGVPSAPVTVTAAPLVVPRVIRLSPDGTVQATTFGETSGAQASSDDRGPRPSIKIQGSAVRTGGRGGDRIEQTMPEEGGPTDDTPRPSALDPEAKRAYESALALVNQRQFSQALDAFAAFLVRWPDHPNADNAFYWRGECYFADGEYARAAEQFEAVIARFPGGNKMSDALLKLGIVEQKLGNPQKAKAQFERLRHDYPRSEAVRRIPSEDRKE